MRVRACICMYGLATYSDIASSSYKVADNAMERCALVVKALEGDGATLDLPWSQRTWQVTRVRVVAIDVCIPRVWWFVWPHLYTAVESSLPSWALHLHTTQ